MVIWFYDKDKTIYCPISQIKQMKIDGKKSVNLKTLIDKKEYKYYDIIGVKKKVYFDNDYTILTQMEDGD